LNFPKLPPHHIFGPALASIFSFYFFEQAGRLFFPLSRSGLTAPSFTWTISRCPNALFTFFPRFSLLSLPRNFTLLTTPFVRSAFDPKTVVLGSVRFPVKHFGFAFPHFRGFQPPPPPESSPSTMKAPHPMVFCLFSSVFPFVKSYLVFPPPLLPLNAKDL